MRTRSKLLAVAALGTLSACALKSPPESAEYLPQALPGVVVPDRFGAGVQEGGAVAGGWAATFGDPRLDVLITEAVAHNPDLLVAAARIEAAAQYVEFAESKLYPQVNFLARGGGEMSGDQSGLTGGGIFADWEVDLWGRVRAGKAANVATYEATVADTEYARQSIAAMVAKSYFLAIEAGLQEALAEEMVATSEQLVMLAGERLRIGRGDGFDAALSRANTESFRDTVLQLTLAREQALRALEALLGRYPAADVDIAPELAKAPAPIPAGLPSELLERRPDVVAADRRVAAAFYRLKEARAARLPTLSLTASVNSVSSELFVLQERENPVWSAGAALLAPVYNGRGLKTQVQIRTAEQRQAIADYGRIGARAFGEVENALSAELYAGRREEVLTRAAAANQEALVLARTRYDIGSGDLRAVQQQQVAVHSSRATLVRVQADRLVQRVNLYLALGGGFDTPAPAVARTGE
jgi:NodT family efflux transporter outer membrane factor (OMF) lipoprotein